MSFASPATVLILGGTSEARELASRLAGVVGIRVVSSLAGRVKDPALPAGEVRIGGFGGPAGLANWLRENWVAAVVDATHPFAQAISASAATACAETATPLLALMRAPWTAGPGERWHEFPSLQAAAQALPALGRRVFLTTGRQGLDAFAALDQMWFLIRCVDPPEGPLPRARQVMLARGPYDAGAERELMRHHAIDVLVTKNSGGSLTVGKLIAARQLGVPTVMISRPPQSSVSHCSSNEQAEAWVLRQLGSVKLG